MQYDTLLHQFADAARAAFGTQLTGVYLHGSAAMGCFHPLSSDLDLIVVVDGEITRDEKLAFMTDVVRLNADAPAKGIEMSVVALEECRRFRHPCPYMLHFSPFHLALWNLDRVAYIDALCGTDRDLAAHFTVMRRYGCVLWGAPIQEVFGEVGHADYVDSLLYDCENAREDILENPVYVMLNLCRILAYLRTHDVLSKRSGGEWGLQWLPERYRPLLRAALAEYGTGERQTYDAALSDEFACFVLEEIRRESDGI